MKLQLRQSCLERKYVLTSITLELSDTIRKYLGYNASGTEVLCAIIYNRQQVNSSAVHALAPALQNMRLMDKPGKDVETFSNKMAEMACQISGTGSARIDLSTLVATALIDCTVLAFLMKATG